MTQSVMNVYRGRRFTFVQKSTHPDYLLYDLFLWLYQNRYPDCFTMEPQSSVLAEWKKGILKTIRRRTSGQAHVYGCIVHLWVNLNRAGR